MKKSTCCERLTEIEWNNKEIIWEDKPFYLSRYLSILHVPINIGGKIREGFSIIEEYGLSAEPMVLSRNITSWGAEILIPISNITDAFEIEILTGRYITGLFEGTYGEIESWSSEMEKSLRSKNLRSKEFIYWYATCPKCAKVYKTVQVVIFARVI